MILTLGLMSHEGLMCKKKINDNRGEGVGQEEERGKCLLRNLEKGLLPRLKYVKAQRGSRQENGARLAKGHLARAS